MIEPTTDFPIAPELVNCRKTFQVSPGTHVKLKHYETSSRGKHDSKAAALLKIESLAYAMDKLQFLLYAGKKQSLLIWLASTGCGRQGWRRPSCYRSDAPPQGCRVQSFKQPTPLELEHVCLWRIERQVPRRGEVVIFIVLNMSMS